MLHLKLKRLAAALLALTALAITACDTTGFNSGPSGNVNTGAGNFAFSGADAVTICHRTNNPDHPYISIRIEPDKLEIYRANGDLVPAPPEGCGDNLLSFSGELSHTPLPGETAVPTVPGTVPATNPPMTNENGNINANDNIGAPPPTVTATAEGNKNVNANGNDNVVVNACAQGRTIAEMLIGTADQETITALRDAGLLDILNNPNRTYLIFLPDEDIALSAITDESLTDVLLAHIVVLDQPLTQQELVQRGSVKALSGETITVTENNGVVVLNDSVRVTHTLVDACNGAIYQIDDLLVDAPMDVENGQGKVTICHRTHSKKKPYHMITIDESAVPAHQAHGDIVPAPADGCPTQ